MQKIIVVFSSEKDATAHRVVHALQDAGACVVFLDTGAFPSRIRLATQFVDTQWRGTFCYEGVSYALEQIQSVLVRRPTHYQVDPQAPELIQAFLENEALKGFGGVLRSLKQALWMNDLDAHRAANFKPVQLQTASQPGLRVPRTLVTNEPAAVRSFYDACAQRMIYKPLHGGGIAGGGRVTHTIFTSLITAESLTHLAQVKLTAHQFQEYIEKAFELRVTVIGRTALAVAIYSQDHAQSSVDWRAGSALLRYRPFELPSQVEQQCVALTRAPGLTYGALDLIVTPDGEYVFLEINAGGQYGWLEDKTGLPFSATIAQVLIQGKEAVYAD